MEARALDREVLTDRRLWGGDRFTGHNFVVSVYTTPGTLVEWYCYIGWTWWLRIRAEASLVFILRPTNNWEALGSEGLYWNALAGQIGRLLGCATVGWPDSRSQPLFALYQNLFAASVRSIGFPLTTFFGTPHLCEEAFSQVKTVEWR
jgi:hypothetical protein